MNAIESDEDLVNGFLRRRDEELFRLLYRRHTPRLYLFSLRLCAGNHHRAEDIVQDAWIRAVENLSTFQWRSRFSTWLNGIAFNCYREHRAKYEEPAKDPETLLAPGKDIDSSLDLEACIRRLPDGCREIFVLHDIEGYTHQEISDLLNIDNGTSKSQLFEARKRLRQSLSK